MSSVLFRRASSSSVCDSNKLMCDRCKLKVSSQLDLFLPRASLHDAVSCNAKLRTLANVRGASGVQRLDFPLATNVASLVRRIFRPRVGDPKGVYGDGTSIAAPSGSRKG